MAQTVKLKRSAVSGNTPTTSDLALGEIAINTYDGNIFIKKNDGSESIVTFSPGSNAGSIEEDSFSGNGSTTAFTLSTAPSSEENLLVFIDATFQNRDSFTISGTTLTFDTAPDNGSSVRVYHIIPGSVDDGVLTVAKFTASALVLESEGISSNDNDTTIPTSAAVKDYVDTQVATVDTLPEVLANGNTTGGTDISVSTGDDITFADSSKAIFGDDGDLEIFHTGASSIIKDGGTGSLSVRGTHLNLADSGGNIFIEMTDTGTGGTVELKHETVTKLATTADGILVTSEVEADEFIGDLRGAVLFKAQAGENVTKGDVVYISGISGNTTVVSKADADDASKMPAFGIVAATTTSGQPVDIYTQGILGSLDTSAYSEGDELFVSTTAGALTDTPPTGETALLQKIAKVTRSDNSAGSIFITGAGRTNAVPNLDQDQFFLGNASNQAVATDFSDAVEALSINNVVEDTTPQLGGDLASNGNDILFGDNDKAIFGAGSDLEIYHDGSNSYVKEKGNGVLNISGGNAINFLTGNDAAETGLTIATDGAVTAYYDNSPKIATTNTGIDVTGTVTADGLTLLQNEYIQIGGAGEFQLFNDGSNTVLRSSDNLLIQRNTSPRTSIKVTDSSGEVELSYAGSPKLATTSSGVDVTGEVLADSLDIDGNGDISGNLTLGGYLAGPATFTIDPAAVGDNTGTVVIAGNLQVDGTTTTINSTTLTVDDKNITLASGSTNAAAANGAGLTVDCGSDTDATFTYDGTNDEWDFNKPIVSNRVNTNTLNNVGNTANIIYRSSTNTIVGNNANALVVQDGGKVIIGDTASHTSDLLQIETPASGGGHGIQIRRNDSNNDQGIGHILFGNNTATDLVKISAKTDGDSNAGDSGALMFSTQVTGGNLTERMRIDSSGNVGIGTDTPAEKISVEPDTDVSAEIGKAHVGYVGHADYAAFSHVDRNTTSAYALLQGAAGQTYLNAASGQKIRFRINNVNAAEFDSSGNFGVNVTDPAAKFQVEEYGIDTTETSTTATTQVAIHTMSATTFRSARFTVQVTNSTDSTYHLTEILMIHDGTTPSITEYGTIFTGSAEATFDADISSGNVRLLATPASTDTMEFKVVAHSITT